MAHGEDHALARVPMESKRKMWEILLIRIGSLACVSQLMLGAALGYGMSFWGAFAATVCGSVILQVVSWAIGTAAARQGMSTSLLSRWSGFGKVGSSIIGGVIAICMMGWFGVQNGIFAEGLHTVTGLLNVPIWAAITGIGITLLVVYGIKAISVAANIFVPLFVIAVLYAAGVMLSGHDFMMLLNSAHPGPELTFAAATTMVAGGFMIGAVCTPDFSRYLVDGKQVFWVMLIGTFVGELGMNLLAVLLAHATGTDNIVDIMMALAGWLGAALVIFSTIKLNDTNLYSSSLGLATMVDALTGKKPSRTMLTWILGIIGTVASMAGVINHFTNFLVLLGVTIPPIAGIIFIDYYVLKRDRKALDETSKTGALPKTVEIVNPIALIAWVLASLIGQFSPIGIPALNALIGAALLYLIIMKIYGALTKQAVVRFRETDKVV